LPAFEYTALDHTGQEQRGVIDAESLADARRKLRATRVHVLSVDAGPEEAQGPMPLVSRRISLQRIRSNDVAAATRQLAMLMNAGIALVPALGALHEQLGQHPLGTVIARVRDRVNEGMSLTKALQEHPKIFSEVFVSMVSAGEASGDLENVLVRLADVSEKRMRLANKVRASLAYPAFMSLVGIGVVIFLLTYVIPSISKLFRDMHRALPWPTVALMAISDFVKAYFLVIIGVVAGAIILSRIWLATPAGRLMWDRLMLRLPLFGDLFRKVAISRFARTLGSLLASGVSILDALEIVKRVVGNAALSHTLDQIKESVRHGDSITNPLRRSGVFPPIVCHMVGSGERGGNIEQGLLKVAEVYDNEVESSVATLTSLLEPVLIIVLGAVVGFIVLAILLPIFEINQAVQ
jgi:general secretion pathway protein F